MLFGKRLHLGRIDVAGDDQNGIGRGVVQAVEGDGIVAAELGHLRHPADHRLAIGMRQIERRVELLAEPVGRVIVGALAPLFLDDLALGKHRLVAQLQIAHPVGLQLHHKVEPILGDSLVIGGEVLAGEGVVLAAMPPHDARELAGRDLGGPLEHQMLEKMRDARLALRLVGGPDLVPDHLGDDGRPAVGDHHHLHAIAKGVAGDFDVERAGRGSRGRGGHRQGGNRNGELLQPWRRADGMAHVILHRNGALFRASEPAPPRRSAPLNFS